MHLFRIHLPCVLILSSLVACSSEDPSKFPVADAPTYQYVDDDIGCNSTYSDDKKEDMFKKYYLNHWFTWSGQVDLSEADSASINVDGKGTQDLEVEFADDRTGYNLRKGQHITVRFVMRTIGGCVLPFSGDNGVVL